MRIVKNPLPRISQAPLPTISLAPLPTMHYTRGRVGELMGLMGNKVFKKVTKIIFENKVLQESY